MRLLVKIFLSGVILAFIAMVVETKLAEFLPLGYISRLEATDLRSTALILLLTFVFIAPLEEILKYLVLKREIFRGKEIDRVIDGVQLGMVLGLGFATLENGFYFFQTGQQYGSALYLFLPRFMLSTLAHVIYSGMMGYYLSLSKFHRLYQGFFLKRALITAILLHGFFNFSLLTQAFYYTVGIIIIAFAVLMKWAIDRRDFETFVIKKKQPVPAPLFADKQEVDTFLVKSGASFSEIKALAFCPRCLAIKKIGEKVCSSCGMRFN